MGTKEKVIGVISEMCGIGAINEGDLLKEDLGLDSLMLLDIIVTLEEIFEIQFDMGELNPDELTDVSALIALVEKTL